ncbi:PREDICTED: tropomyosin-like [Nicotiana attenuata]|uniref:tropomyosin-like n=1 Tax=Nicotiana attenuata TaxID=49451 RepID=UPI00090484FF|nr:PREDICTED: tropomyosin-like [Nicotiana attenuata]
MRSALSVDPDCKRTAVFTIPADTRVLSSTVGVASYLSCLVTEEDQAKMNKVSTSSLFNEAQQALNRVGSLEKDAGVQRFQAKTEYLECKFSDERHEEEMEASVLHHVSFHQFRMEVRQLEFELKEQVRQKDMYMVLREQKDEALKDLPILRAELEKAQKEAFSVKREHAELVEKLWAEMNELKTLTETLRSRIDLLASKKEAKEELASVKDQLQVAKDKADKCKGSFNNKGLICKATVRSETLEEIHDRGFDVSAEIEEAKRLEAEAKELYELEGFGAELSSGED